MKLKMKEEDDGNEGGLCDPFFNDAAKTQGKR